jgi:hypothetical protein
MWLKLYQSASIWLCFGPTSPHSSIVPQVQIGGRPIAHRIATATPKTAMKVGSGVGRGRQAGMGEGVSGNARLAKRGFAFVLPGQSC